MTREKIKKKYGFSTETFGFYVKMGIIKKIGKDNYKVNSKLEGLIIEKSTIYKYYFSDSFMEDMKEFVKATEHNSKIKVYNKKEIEEYLKKKKG